MNPPTNAAGQAGLPWLNPTTLSRSRGRVVPRAALEQLLTADRLQADLAAHQQEVQARLQAVRLAAEQAGHAAGHAAGLAAGRAEWARQLAERQARRHAQLDDLRPTLVGVVMQALQHLVRQLPQADRFELLAAALIEQAVHARRLRLVVAAADGPAAQALLARWAADGASPRAGDVLIDDTLQPGDCVLETDETAIDGRLSLRLSTLQASLDAALKAATPDGAA
ncbi:FliH/SctL family protein [Aquabacterium sp. OR-4]|uniref:FliH/SctL family protein n=1 Tax=Aquabacterium sp. OR-4 TaxID=2978127 RepID=UPI0028C9EA80|nr:FliH/SctL family protein [Aquabacterium sp. OR-4]MDT7836049.1 FliH/SctL family protein [Aquabacterium sp. OR-4]